MMEQQNFSRRRTACLVIFALLVASQPCQANEAELTQQESRSLSFLQNIVWDPAAPASPVPAPPVQAPPVQAPPVQAPPVTPNTSKPTPYPTVAGTPGPTHGSITAITHTPTVSTGTGEVSSTADSAVQVASLATLTPTTTPTKRPTTKPTASPTVMASAHPTASPSRTPTAQPSAIPTKSPTMSPSVAPSSIPSAAPSEAPSPAPTVTPDCIDDLSKVHDMEINIQDTRRRRKYWLCPDTVFNMGTLASNGTIVNGQNFIMLRPNVIYQCGLDGSRSNNCTIQGGDFGVTSFYGVYEGIQETVNNAIIQGLTFVGQNLFSVVLEAAGDVTFQDCEFRDQESMAPVLIQWNGEAPHESLKRRLRSTRSLGTMGFQDFHQRHVQKRMLEDDADDDDDDDAADDDHTTVQETGTQAPDTQDSAVHSAAANGDGHDDDDTTVTVPDTTVTDTSTGAGTTAPVRTTDLRHTVTFKQCVFRNNRANKQYGLAGMIENTYQSELVIEHCLFENNDYGETTNSAPFGYAIRSFGPLTVEASCFNDNKFRKDAPVVVYNDLYSSINNYATPKPDSLYCGLMALYNNGRTGMVTPASSLIDEGTPDCVESDVDSCLVQLAPTSAPTQAPTLEPTAYAHSGGTSRIHISTMAVLALSSILLVVSL